MNRNRKAYLCVFALAVAVVGAGLVATGQSGCAYNSNKLRPLYFDCEFQAAWLAELPEMPADFWDTQALFLYGFVPSFKGKILNKSYWAQPEWFPNLDNNIAKITSNRRYIAETGRWPITIWGSGIYPSEFYVKTGPGANLTVYTWIKNLAIQWKYEGVGLEPFYPAYEKIEDTRGGFDFDEIMQDPGYAAGNIELAVSPDELLLSPAYPVLEDGYVHMVRVDVRLSDDIKPGRYIAGFKAGSPSEEFSEDMRLEHGFGYTDPIGEFATSPRKYKLFIEVVESD